MSTPLLRTAEILVQDQPAAKLIQINNHYTLIYYPDYTGYPISLTLPLTQKIYEFDDFPAFFDGLLPEGPQLEALLKQAKLDRDDYFGQLAHVGNDLVGAVTFHELTSDE